MKYTVGKNLDWKLSKIAFGGASLSGVSGGYGFGPIDAKDSQKLIEDSVALGINVFDTAPIYGFGQSERSLGEFLKKIRDDIYLVSKAGVSWHENKRVNMSNDPKLVLSMFEQSLRDLQSDYIDIYMIHWPDASVDIRDALNVLQKQKDQGKIRAIGLCNTNLVDLHRASEVCRVDFVQSEFNLFNSGFKEIEDYIQKENILTMGWGTFDKGILAQSVKDNSRFDKSDCRSWAPWWKKSNWKERVKKVSELGMLEGYTIKQIALSYSLQNMDLSICGIKSQGHLQELYENADLKIPSDILQNAYEYFNE